MKNILIIILFLFGFNIYSQSDSLYWFRIVDSSKIPIVTKEKKSVILDFNDKSLNEIFKKYNIVSFERSFPTSNTPFLQTYFEMKIEDISLISEMKNKLSNIFLNIEEAPEIQLLYIPNDYGTNGGVLLEQEELNYINAPEAWDLSHGNSDIVLGISEGVNINHPELIGKSDILNGNSSNGNYHGTSVALFAGASTDNASGISSVGFDSFIRGKSGGSNAVIQLAQDGVKVINMSWGSCGYSSNSIRAIQAAMDEAYSNGAVLVAAAGNGAHSCPSLGANAYHFPAASNNVIAVTSIGHLHPLGDTDPTHYNQKDKFWEGGTYPTLTYNDEVDIAAPGRHILAQENNPNESYLYRSGTSFAAPIVTGTIGLMLDVNYCLSQIEIETILKLSSKKVDHLPVNSSYYGEIGSGVLDAYEAVKMSKDMFETYGTVEVKDRILYRWLYKLETAPYEIKMTNNDVTGNARLKFKAKNNIEILSEDYYPSTGGYVDLSIDNTIAADCLPPLSNGSKQSNTNKTDNRYKESSFKIIPTLVAENTLIKQLNESGKDMTSIRVYDFFGGEVHSQKGILEKEVILNLQKLTSGIYIVKIYDSQGENIHTQKIIKK